MTKNLKKRAYKKKPYAKRRARGGAIPQFTIGREIVARRQFTRLVYEVGQIGTTTTTGLGNFQLRLNSLFDPQYTVGGGQPQGYDQLTQLYTNYRVHGARVDVYAQSLTPSNQSIVSLIHRTQVAVPSDVRALMESPNGKFCMLTSDKPCHLSKYFPIAKILGITKVAYNSDAIYASGSGADPIQLSLCNISWCNINEVTSTGHNIRATITYYAEFFKPQILGPS